jgi:hypothetical protein
MIREGNPRVTVNDKGFHGDRTLAPQAVAAMSPSPATTTSATRSTWAYVPCAMSLAHPIQQNDAWKSRDVEWAQNQP